MIKIIYFHEITLLLLSLILENKTPYSIVKYSKQVINKRKSVSKCMYKYMLFFSFQGFCMLKLVYGYLLTCWLFSMRSSFTLQRFGEYLFASSVLNKCLIFTFHYEQAVSFETVNTCGQIPESQLSDIYFSCRLIKKNWTRKLRYCFNEKNSEYCVILRT